MAMIHGPTPRWRPGLSFCLAFALIGTAANARGALMRYEYRGVITSADASSGIAPGTRFSGTFAYDPAEKGQFAGGIPESVGINYGQTFGLLGTPEPAGATPALGLIGKADSAELTASVGGKPLYAQSGGLQVTNFYGDWTGAKTDLVISNGNLGDLAGRSVWLDFRNTDRPVYPTLNPPDAIHLSDFTSASFGVASPGSPPLQGTIDTLTPIPTPEPSAGLLLGLAAATYLARTRGRRS